MKGDMQMKKPVTIFDRFGIIASFNDLFFDTTMDAAIATINVVNDTNNTIVLELCDIYRDGELIHYTNNLCEPISPHSTLSKRLLSLAGETEEETVLKFYEGEIREFSFRLCAYIYDKKSDFQYPFYYLGKGDRIVLSGISLDKLKVLPADCFEIQNEGNYIVATTDHYIPFELPKSDMVKADLIKRFKSELIDQLATLETITFRHILFAQFGMTEPCQIGDIENHLIYNIGPSVFTNIAKTSIAFAEVDSTTIKTAHYFDSFNPLRKYNYKYEMVLPEELQKMTESKRVLAYWNAIPINLNIKHSAERYWNSIRDNAEKISVLGQLKNEDTDSFGIYVELHLPQKISPANVIKSLLDGIICAFHKQLDMDDLMTEITGNDYEKKIPLAENRIGLLGKYSYVIKRGNSTQWSPADDRLKFCWLAIIQEETAPYFSGKILEW